MRPHQAPAGSELDDATEALSSHVLATLQALAEPNRLRIVELLREGPLAVGEVADRLGLRQPQTSKHLKVLGESGLVTAKADGNRRVYSLRPAPLQGLEAWLDDVKRAAEERYDRLDDYLRRLRSEG